MIIDFHIHMFLPQYASSLNKEPAPGLPKPPAPPAGSPPVDKSPEGLKKSMTEMGVSHAVIQHIAMLPGQSKAVNDYARELAKDKDGFYLQFGAFHPDDSPDDLKELESGVFYGVKLHPYLQNFDIDDKKMYPAYEMLSSLKLPVLFHTGCDPFDDTLRNAFPEKIVKIHKDFPDLTIIGAHLGAHSMYDEAEKYIAGTDMYIDISVTVEFCKDIKQYERIIKKHDPDKILFGSDSPMGNVQRELDFLNRLNLGSDLMDKILYKNAQGLLGIK